MNRKILFFLHTLDQRSVPLIALNIVKAIKKHDVEIKFLLAIKPVDYYIKKLKDENIPYDYLTSNHKRTTFIIPKLIKYLYKNRPCLVVSFVNGANRAIILARYFVLRKFKIIINVHNTFTVHPYDFKAIRTFMTKLLYPKADYIVAISSGVKEDLINLNKKMERKIKIIPNIIIDDDFFIRKSERLPEKYEHLFKDSDVIINVSNLSERKNIPLLIKTFDLISHKLLHKNLKLIIIGRDENKLWPQYQKIIEQHNLNSKVSFLGYQQNPLPFIRKSKILMLTSWEEGLPTVLIEAIGCGIPVISTNCKSGPKDIIIEGVNGFLCPVDDHNCLADKAITLLEDSNIHKRFRSNVEKTSSRYTPAEIGVQFLELFNTTFEGDS